MNTLENREPAGWLSWFLKGLLVLVAIILFGRLAELQIIKGDYYRELSDNNRIRHIPISAPRGRILGSDGQVLAGNIPLKEKIIFSKNGFEKSLDTSNADPANIITENKRNYFLGSAAAHLTGYLGQVNPDEVNKVDPNCPDKGPRLSGNLIGRSGLEEEYDCSLRGIDGVELVEVDASGNPVRVLGIKKPVPGEDLTTTINPGLQQKVASVMRNFPKQTNEKDDAARRLGAVVITNGYGKVLAMYSSPSYDPNAFVNGNSKEINSITTDTSLPLFNRFLDGLYHPGSTFKIVTSTAALEENKINENFTYKDTGTVTVNGFSYTNWYFTEFGKTEGEINLVKAIARSTDTFFYKVGGELVGIEDLSNWANKFNLNKVTGIDLPDETSGLIPDPAWKRQFKGELWFLGDTYNVAIGQGDVVLTPLAANTLAATIANSGQICKPYLNANLNSDCKSLNLNPKTLNLIKEGMVDACSVGGTAFPFFDFKPQVACKTGTAETGDNNKTHAWFTAFAPADNPKIVIDIIVEKAGQGSEVAAPIAKEILQYYFSK